MILNNAPANEAVVSNVGEIGEFRIRNSAKAFSILSSGLYANKIRAVIRELLKLLTTAWDIPILMAFNSGTLNLLGRISL